MAPRKSIIQSLYIILLYSTLFFVLISSTTTRYCIKDGWHVAEFISGVFTLKFDYDITLLLRFWKSNLAVFYNERYCLTIQTSKFVYVAIHIKMPMSYIFAIPYLFTIRRYMDTDS